MPLFYCFLTQTDQVKQYNLREPSDLVTIKVSHIFSKLPTDDQASVSRPSNSTKYYIVD